MTVVTYVKKCFSNALYRPSFDYRLLLQIVSSWNTTLDSDGYYKL